AGPADAAAAARLVADGTVAETMIARDLPLRRLAALLEAARVFVGNDSGPSHLAAALGCPTLVLFGPTDPAVWAPVGDRVTTLGGRGAGAETPWDGLTVERVETALGAWLMPIRALAG
ncbi:MAG: glycosyltransferase family 9 protein, partial [bacterium]